MLFPQASSPHLPAATGVGLLMRRVIYALVPGVIVAVALFGWGVLFNLMFAAVTAVACEAAMLRLRRKPVANALADGSALVTAVLLGLALPALAPWWLTVSATAFAMIIAKHLYGGLGYNPFNPAMIGYVVALISFPLEMTRWVMPFAGLELYPWQALAVQLGGDLPTHLSWDAVTSATPLDSVKTELSRQLTLSELRQNAAFGTLGANGWELLNLAFLVGGLYLLWRKVIRWHIPVAMLAAMFLMATLFHLFDSDTYTSPVFHLFAGGTMLGAFFIATDPVSGSTTDRGRLVYGAGIGLLSYIIRTWGGYPDGIAFAVLLMNMAVPTIDYYTQPRVFGEPRE